MKTYHRTRKMNSSGTVDAWSRRLQFCKTPLSQAMSYGTKCWDTNKIYLHNMDIGVNIEVDARQFKNARIVRVHQSLGDRTCKIQWCTINLMISLAWACFKEIQMRLLMLCVGFLFDLTLGTRAIVMFNLVHYFSPTSEELRCPDTPSFTQFLD